MKVTIKRSAPYKIIAQLAAHVVGDNVPLVATFTASSTEVEVGDEVLFIYTGQPADQYRWDFGDGSPISLAEDPTHSYEEEGTYTVTLWATNEGLVRCGTHQVAVGVTEPAATLPVVSSLDTAALSQGAAGEAVVITGQYFTGATAVSLGAGVTVDSFVVDSDTQITATITVPLAATLGNRTVGVTTSAGTGQLVDGFEVLMVAEALTFIAEHEALSGTTMGSRQRTAINELYLGYKGIGTTNGSNLWDKYDHSKHIEYPFCPIDDTTAGSAPAYGLNLINPAAFSLTWFNFVPADLTIYGVTGNGTSKYATTGLNILHDIGTFNFGAHAYLRTQNTLTQAVFGAVKATVPYDGLQLIPHFSGNDVSFIGVVTSTALQSTRTGLMSVQNDAGTQKKLRNGTLYDSRANSGTLQNLEIFGFCRNFGGTPNSYCSLQVASLHPCTPVFTATEMEDYNEIWQRFHTRIIPGGRNV